MSARPAHAIAIALNAPPNGEVDRILRTYARRAAHPTSNRAKRGNRAIIRERERQTARLLARHALLPLTGRLVLDVGCSYGTTLARLTAFGARPEDLVGIDLLDDRLAAARHRYPRIRWLRANAEHLDFPDASFHLVLAFTVFSSILDDRTAGTIAAEILRVLRPRGAVLWYDFRYDDPRNADVRGITLAAIGRLFPGVTPDVRSLTLLPRLARRLGPMTGLLYPILAGVPALRTHYLGLLRKP
jgi:SAM-dependent methyltransferase